MLAAAFLWGSGYIVMKYVLRSFHPMTVIFLRMAVASVSCILLIPIVKIRVSYRPGDWKWLLAMVLCEPCLYFVFEGYALRYTSASQAGMLVAAMPVFVGLGAWLVLKEKLSPTVWLGCLLAVVGVVWLNLGAVANEHAPRPILGNSLESIAMLFGGGYAICVRKLSVNYCPVFLTAAQVWVGTLFFFPGLFLPGGGIPTDAPLPAFIGIAYLGLGMSFLAYLLYNFSLERLPAGKVSIYLNLIPVFTLIMGMLVLGERLTLMQYAASALVLGGVIISQRR
jgi:drug/metabolite transporter (DMT)-like permease